jgi:hypothetical protein
MSKIPILPWFSTRCGAADPAVCEGCDGCGGQPKPPPRLLDDVCFLPGEPLACADVLALAPLPVVIAGLSPRGSGTRG